MPASYTPGKLNNRQYLFCLNILKGMKQTDAYLEAGYKTTREMATVCACDLLTKPHVSSFLAAQQAKQLATVESILLSKPEKRQILATFARANLIDLVDDDGKPKKLNKNSPGAKALKEFYRKDSIDKNGNATTTSSLKMIDPITAIMEDNKMTGDYAPIKSLNAHKILFEVNMVEKQKRGEAED